MDTQFDDLSELNPNIKYYCSPWIISSKFTHLMKLVLMVREHPEAIPLIDEIVKDKQKLNERNTHGWSALMIACRNSNIRSNNLVVKMLIDAGADVNVRCIDNTTPLIEACKYSGSDSNIETVEMLINSGSNTNIMNNNGWTALMITILYHTINKNHLEVMKMLIDAGTDVNIISPEYNITHPALMCACRYPNTEIIKILIDAGVDVNIKTVSGSTALFISIKSNNGYTEVVQLLINAGADVNIKNTNNQTVLMLLLKGKNCNDIIIQLLHTSRHTLLDTDFNGKSAYDYYVENDHDILDEYHLKILKGDISPNCTKSARFC